MKSDKKLCLVLCGACMFAALCLSFFMGDSASPLTLPFLFFAGVFYGRSIE